MRIENILANLFSFVLEQRRSGTSTLIKKTASENDVWVLVPNMSMKKEIGKKAIIYDELIMVDGFSPKPILIDNAVFLEVIQYSLEKIEELHRKIQEFNLINEKK